MNPLKTSPSALVGLLRNLVIAALAIGAGAALGAQNTSHFLPGYFDINITLGCDCTCWCETNYTATNNAVGAFLWSNPVTNVSAVATLAPQGQWVPPHWTMFPPTPLDAPGYAWPELEGWTQTQYSDSRYGATDPFWENVIFNLSVPINLKFPFTYYPYNPYDLSSPLPSLPAAQPTGVEPVQSQTDFQPYPWDVNVTMLLSNGQYYYMEQQLAVGYWPKDGGLLDSPVTYSETNGLLTISLLCTNDQPIDLSYATIGAYLLDDGNIPPPLTVTAGGVFSSDLFTNWSWPLTPADTPDASGTIAGSAGTLLASLVLDPGWGAPPPTITFTNMPLLVRANRSYMVKINYWVVAYDWYNNPYRQWLATATGNTGVVAPCASTAVIIYTDWCTPPGPVPPILPCTNCITGQVNMLGALAPTTQMSVRAFDGAGGSEPPAFLAAPGPFTIAPVVASDAYVPFGGNDQPYKMQATMDLSHDTDYEYFASPILYPVEVPCTNPPCIDITNNFVMCPTNPGIIRGTVFLTSSVTDQTYYNGIPPMSALQFATYAGGLPQDPAASPDLTLAYVSYIQATGGASAPGQTQLSTGGGSAVTEFDSPGAFSSANSNCFAGQYSLRLAGLQGQPSTWDANDLHLVFGTPVNLAYDIIENGAPYTDQLMTCAATLTNNITHCFSAATISVVNDDPIDQIYDTCDLTLSGSGPNNAYTVSQISTNGWPCVYTWNANPHLIVNEANITLFLPEGNYQYSVTIHKHGTPPNDYPGTIHYGPISLSVSCPACLQVTCPTNKTLPCACTNLFDFDEPTATPCCYCTNVVIAVASTVVSNYSPCQVFSTRTWLITDNCANSNYCSQMLTFTNCMAISGIKFNDANGEGLPGWTIYAKDQNHNVFSAVTDAQGRYHFILPCGTYTITEAQQQGWVQAWPSTGSYQVTPASATTMDLNFGNYYPAPGEKVVQWPDESTMGLDVNAGLPVGWTPPPALTNILADDFSCVSAGPITNIQIWGSWLGDAQVDNTRFLLGIWSDVPASYGYFSYPGTLLWSEWFEPGAYSFAFYANANEHFYEPLERCDLDPLRSLIGSDTKIWLYSFTPTNPFCQTGASGSPVVYWLSVSADVDGDGLFGWKTSATHWGDAAVYGHLGPDGYEFVDWQELVDPRNTNSLDLSFLINSCTNLPVIICPTNMVVVSCTEVPVYWNTNVIATSACCANVSVVFTPPSGSPFLPGTTNIVQCVATDCCGNSSTCSFTVTVLCCVPPPRGLTAWWPFDEPAGSTSANDLAGQVNNLGYYLGNPTPTAGMVGNALCFNGSSGVLVSNQAEINFIGSCTNGTNAAESFTIDAWIRAKSDRNLDIQTLLDKRGFVGTSAQGYNLFLFNGNLAFQIADGVSWANYTSSQPDLRDGRWHFIAVTVARCGTNGNTGVLYVDGKSVSSFVDPRTGDLNNPANLFMGQNSDGSYPYSGCLDEVEIYKRALSAAELQGIFHASFAGKCKCAPPAEELSAWWPFDEPAGPTANDIAGRVNNAGAYNGNPTPAPGMVGNALCFNGITDFLLVTNQGEVNFSGSCAMSSNVPESFTIDTWLRVNYDTTPNEVQTLLDKRDNADTNPQGYHFYLLEGRPGLQLATGFGAHQNYDSATPDLRDGRWHFIAVTVARCGANGNAGAFYLDGNLVSTFLDPQTGDLDNSANLFIGQNADGVHRYSGCLDELELTKRVLAPQEIQRLFTAASTGKCRTNCLGVLTLSCPTNMLVWSENCANIPVYWNTNVTATSACCGNVPAVFTPPAGSPFAPGTNWVTCTATDCCGNSNSCQFSVAVGCILISSVHPIWPGGNTNVLNAESTLVCAVTSVPGVPVLYQWYKSGSAIVGATSSLYTWLLESSDQAAQYYCQASLAAPYSSITTNTGSVSMDVLPPVYYTNGLKLEMFVGVTNLSAVEQGNVGPANWLAVMSNLDNPGGYGSNYVTRVSGWFLPPTTDNYVFFVATADDSDLFLSTDATAENKVYIAQEPGWSGLDAWLNGGTQARSDTFVNPVTGATPGANGIPLTADEPYYLELVHHEDGGADNFGVTYQTATQMAGPNWANVFTNGAPSLLQASNHNIMLATWPPTTLTWITQPTNTTGTAGFPVTFYAQAASDSEFLVNYQWYRGGAAIAGATTTSYSIGATAAADNGAQIYVVAATAESELSITSSVVTLTVQPAVLERGFARADWWWNNPGLVAIEAGAAGSPNNSLALPGWEAPTANTNLSSYQNRISGLFFPAVTGDYVFFVNSVDESDLFLSTDATRANRRMIAQETQWANAWEWLSDEGGEATPYSISQKRSDQWSPDGGATVPYANGIPLDAGQPYYLEADHTAGADGDGCQVTCKLVTDPDPANGTDSALVGNRIGIYVPRCSYVTVTSQPQSVTVTNYQGATFTAGGVTDSTIPVGSAGAWTNEFTNFLLFQWCKNSVAIPGATTSALTLPLVLPSDNGAELACQMRALGYVDNNGNALWTNSLPATLTVVATPPHLLYAAIFTNYATTNFGNPAVTYVDLAFDNPMDPAALSNPANYMLGSGLAITGITVNSNDFRGVELAVAGTPTFPFTVTVNGLTGLGGPPIAPGSGSTSVQTVPLTVVDIGSPLGGDPAVASDVYVVGTNAYTVRCEGSDIWNNADGFNFCFEPETGGFNVMVRVEDVTHTSNWSRAGLMVRESLDPGARNWNIVNGPVVAGGIDAPGGSGHGADMVECNCRILTGGASSGWATNTTPWIPAYPNAWVRLMMSGTFLMALASTNGQDWVALGYTDTSAGPEGRLTNLLVGICSSAHNNDSGAYPPLTFLDTVHYANYSSSLPCCVPPPVLPLTIAIQAGRAVFSWTPAGGTLWASPALTGPNVNWQPVGPANPATIPITNSAQFFRVKY